MRNKSGKFDRLKFGNDADGKSRSFAKPGEASQAIHHDPNEARAGDVGISPGFMKAAAPKAMHPVSVHSGMTARQQAGAGIGGMGHSTAAVSDGGQTIATSAAAAPLAHAYGDGIPKSRGASPISPGMVSKTRPATDKSALGRAILDAAGYPSSAGLPSTVKAN